MRVRRRGLPAVVFAITVLAANLAWGLGFRLGQTKEQLKLDYDVSAVDHGTGRVTVNLMIADEGRLKPLSAVELVIPGQEGSGHVDLSVPVATRKVDGNLLINVHLKREWAERAEIQLRTLSLDGKKEALTWYFHAIPIAKCLKNADPKNN
jgi:hypothetical protein